MEKIVSFITSTLNDDYGISERAFMDLHELVNSLDQNSDIAKELHNVLLKVDATDGRFYLPEEV